jgi:sigma-B regulation protein RsbU (phosphoserine phosphatase)
MYQGMLALREGNLEHRIPVRRQDQLGLLAHSFNQMTSSITRFLEEMSEKKLLEQELEIAREVQATLFPKQLPRPRGLSLFGGCEPARTVSGDYYDFVVEDDTRLHIVVADISGKGISAALLMANLQAAMRNHLMAVKHGTEAENEARLAEVMGHLNRQIFQNSPSGKYATLFLGRYDAELRELCYCNAGHLPPILLHNGSVERLEAGGTVVGLFEQTLYEARTVRLKPGTVMALFTDGVTEAVNEQDEEYGEQRLIESLARLRDRPPELIYRQLSDDLRSWQGPLKQHDDITLIIGRVD